MLRLAAERDRLRVVDDQVGCPTYAPDLAAAILAIARLAINPGWKADFAGVTHIAGPDAMTWYGFAREIINAAALRGGRSVPIDPISTLEYPTSAERPSNSCLSTSRLQAVFELSLPRMKNSLEVCLDRLMRR